MDEDDVILLLLIWSSISENLALGDSESVLVELNFDFILSDCVSDWSSNFLGELALDEADDDADDECVALGLLTAATALAKLLFMKFCLELWL